MNYQKTLTEIRSQESVIKNIDQHINFIELKIENLINSIDNKYLSITVEEVLFTLPNKALGSKEFSQKLNTQAQLYQDSQFNKIIRFLTLIEEIENDYNNSYSKIGKSYFIKPIKKDIETLVSKYTLLKNEYNLMNVIVYGIKTDKVLFNKIYNLLEDRGVFMTVYDKANYHNLSSIALDMNKLLEQSYLINENLSSINNEFWENNNKLEDLNQSLEDLNQSFNELDASVKAGNLLSAVQTYQLYKINKNTKRTNK
jgi:hypothetical protein